MPQQAERRDPTVEAALHQLETAALNFAYRFINIATVRQEYIRLTQQFTQEIRAAYDSGQMTAKQAAEAAHQMRNQVLDMSRANSADLGQALARQLKAQGLDMEVLLERYAQRKFKTPFGRLTNAQQTEVYLELVSAAGRPNPKVSVRAARLGALGRSLFLLSLGVATYNIATAEDPAWQAGREGANLGGGFVGGLGGGAAAGAWFGPWGVAIGAVIGGVLGAVVGDEAYVVGIGAADESVRQFLAPYVGFLSRDEKGLAAAIYDRLGINMDRVYGIFVELDRSYTTDADDVAELYVNRVRERGGTVQHALRLHRPLRELLIKILDEGWTSAGEKNCISYLRSL